MSRPHPPADGEGVRDGGRGGVMPSLPGDECRFAFHPSGTVQAAGAVLLQSERSDGWMATAWGGGGRRGCRATGEAESKPSAI